MTIRILALTVLSLINCVSTGSAQIPGTVGKGEIVFAQKVKTIPRIVVSPEAGTWEKQAATDLVKYIEMMTGAKPQLAATAEIDAAALKDRSPVLIVGSMALKADPSLQTALDKVKKKNPLIRADAIAVRRIGNRVFLAGSNDESHYFAVS